MYEIDRIDNDNPVLDGFISDDGKHHVIWDYIEVSPGMEYEAWVCETHHRLYFGGCNKIGGDDT